MKNMEKTVDFVSYIQNHVLATLKTTLTLLTDDKLEFNPGKNLNTLKFLMYHVINSPYIYLSGIGKKEFSNDDFNSISIDINKLQSFKDLISYYDKFHSFLEIFKSELILTYLDNEISYNLKKVGWGSWSLTGQRAFETAFEEMVHHRGQIYIYLRLLGIKPPIIYPYL